MTTTFTHSFSEETWKQKYKFGNDKTVDDTFRRVANDLASIEQDKEYWANQFFSIMENFQFIPGGRILSNAGTGLTGTTYINCFVDGFLGNDQDSISGIYNTLQRQAQILKSEGGYGFCCSIMRPRTAHIRGIGNQSPGSIKFLELWDKSSEVITAGSGAPSSNKEKNFIRKGAQMVTIHCWHPDVFEFIEAKKTEGRLSKFNMSVLCTDDFMERVLDGGNWELKFPNYEKYSNEYKKHWDGNLEKWIKLINEEDSLVVYKTISARELWDKIMENTYNRNEPGVLFVDTMNRMNNLWYDEYIMATNPCGEQILPLGAVCLLGSLNLVHFISRHKKNWDYKALERVISVAIRLMDNVNDITYVPLKEQKENLENKRRIGLGVLGYGSALMMLGVRYGSKEALKLTNELMEFITNTAYKTSVELAREKGVFPNFDKEKYLAGNFIKTLWPETQELIAQYGIRNSHLTSIQPTGNTSVTANLVSGGLEPSFSVPGYIRTAIQPFAPEGLEVPKHIDWKKKSFECKETKWQWVKEGDEDLLATKFEGKVWKFDRTRGLVKEELVEDYAISWLKLNNLYDEKDNAIVSSMQLTVDDHVNTMAIFAKNVDSAISKTVNLKNDYSYEDFKQVYLKAWQQGIKGFTTYREGTMTNVLSTKSSLNEPKKRPKELPCDVYHATAKGNHYFVLVGKLDDKPYEIFAGKNGFLAKDVKTGKIIKRGKNYKAIFDDKEETELCPITSMCSEHEESITRLSSALLRTGAEISLIVDQLEKVGGDITSFAKALARTLKRYIPDDTKVNEQCPECGKEDLVRAEGCKTCKSCGWSKCV
jgi:ribonucleoside-diphosphate reductase alpha chain